MKSNWPIIRAAIAMQTLTSVLIGCSPTISGETSLAELPEDISAKAKESLQLIDQNWYGKGNVVVGQVRIPDGLLVNKIASRTVLTPDGHFAAALYPGKTLNLFAHGYRAVSIRVPSNAAKIHRVDPFFLQRMPDAEMASVRGTVSMSNRHSRTPVRVQLKIEQPPPIWDDDGYEGGDMQPVVAKTRVAPGEEFHFDGLSDFPYVLSVDAPHFIERNIPIITSDTKETDLGEIELQMAPRVQFACVSQFADSTSISELPRTTIDVECNGANTFLMTSQKDELGNSLDLRLRCADENKVVASFWFSPSRFYDLGPRSLKSVQEAFSPAKVRAAHPSMENQVLENGHVYYFECPAKKTTCLFEVIYLDDANDSGKQDGLITP